MDDFKLLKLHVFFVALLTLSQAFASPVRVAISSGPNNLNPFFSTDGNSQNIGRLTHISLIDFSDDMQFVCRACSSYSESFPSNGHAIRFKIRDDLKFWDGEKVTAKHIEQAVRYFQTDDERIKSIFRFSFAKIKDVVIHGRLELSLVFESFSLENKSNLALLKILKFAKPYAVYKEKISLDQIIGAGEYRYGKVDAFQVELLPIDTNKPKLVFKVVKDETTLALKMKNKEIDLSVTEISPRKYQWLESNSNHLNFITQRSTIYRYINFNHKKDFFKDIKVRKALSLLIPRKEILDFKLKNNAVLAKGVLSPAFSKYFLDSSLDEFNLEEANRLLDEAGYKKDKDGIRYTLVWKSTNNRSILELVNIFKNYFQRAGIQVNVVTQEWGTFMRSIKTGNFDIYTGQWIGFTGPDFFSYLFHSKKFPPKGANRGFYINKKLDEALDKAEIETNETKRISLYKKAQEIVNNDYPYIHLWHPNVMWISRKCISLPSLYPNGSYYPLLGLSSSCDG